MEDKILQELIAEIDAVTAEIKALCDATMAIDEEKQND